jgi:hypothetical protein
MADGEYQAYVQREVQARRKPVSVSRWRTLRREGSPRVFDSAVPATPEPDSDVKADFTAFDLTFEAWIAEAWPLCERGSVHWHQRREAYRAGFETALEYRA